jgi:asparagine synthase (glutamine-hydrolysing)
MCSFLCTTRSLANSSNLLLKLRGPDHTERIRYKNFNIVHNLLDISRQTAIQPIIEDDKLLLYNGEIYKPESLIDTQLILPLYKRNGHQFVNSINGEYAIAIIDGNNIFLYSDVFGTKPLFYSVEGSDIGISTYSSELSLLKFKDIKRVEPSTYIHIDIKSSNITIYNHSGFDLTEYKTTYDDCIRSFENACRLRCNDRFAVGLSSGHDSGSILQWCVDNNKGNFYYVVTNREDVDVMLHRKRLCIEKGLGYKEIDFHKNKYIHNHFEENMLSSKMEEYKKYKGEPSTMMISKLLRKVKSDGIDIFIAGQGGDEIVSNYIEDDIFFTDLKVQFPWKNFYYGENRLYIDQFEYIGGVYGVEVRYPFLDREFVQEFLHLTLELKNKFYKSVISEYLNRNNMPTKTEKVGFSME